MGRDWRNNSDDVEWLKNNNDSVKGFHDAAKRAEAEGDFEGAERLRGWVDTHLDGATHMLGDKWWKR